MKFLRDNQTGQGLLETIVALGIIVAGVVGTMNLTLSNQKTSQDTVERLIATNLAREGIEIVRSIRDTNWLTCEIISDVLTCNTWDLGLVSASDTTAVPIFDIASNAWTINFTANDLTHNHARVWRKNAGGADNIGTQFQSTLTTPADSALTGYRRMLELQSICTNKTISESCASGNSKIGIRVQAHIQWKSSGTESDLIVEERIFNWR